MTDFVVNGRATLLEVSTPPVVVNVDVPVETIEAAVDEISRDRSAMSLESANREIYQLLKDGIKISIPDREHGGQKIERLRVVDWEQPEQNDFLLVSQMSVVGALYTCRPDLIGFVNGLPWVVIELKKPTDTLLDQLKAAGVAKSSASDVLTEGDKQKLLSHLSLALHYPSVPLK